MTTPFAYHLVREREDAPVTDVYAIPWRDGPVRTVAHDPGSNRWLCRPGLLIHTWRSAVLRLADRQEAELVTAQLGRVLPSERHLTRICERADASGMELAGDPLLDGEIEAGRAYWPAMHAGASPVRRPPQARWWVLPRPNPYKEFRCVRKLMVIPPAVVLARAIHRKRTLLQVCPEPVMTELFLFDLDTGTPTFHVPDPAELLGAADGRLFVRRGDRVVGYDVHTGADVPVNEDEIPDSARNPRQNPFSGVHRTDQVPGVTYHRAGYTAWDTSTTVMACEDDTEVLWRFDIDGFDSRGAEETVPLPGRVLVLSSQGGIICLAA